MTDERIADELPGIQARALAQSSDLVWVKVTGLSTHTSVRRKLSPVRELHKKGLVSEPINGAIRTYLGIRVAKILRSRAAS